MWGQAFQWKNRELCLTRVILTMKCVGLDVDKAVDQAIHRTDDYGLKYCVNPDQIPPEERERLRSNALAALPRYGAIQKWEGPAGVGNAQQARMGDLLENVITS